MSLSTTSAAGLWLTTTILPASSVIARSRVDCKFASSEMSTNYLSDLCVNKYSLAVSNFNFFSKFEVKKLDLGLVGLYYADLH